MPDYRSTLREHGAVPEDWSAFQQEMCSVTDGDLQSFYTQGFEYLSRPLQDIELVSMDIETTGLNAGTDRIVSVGLVHFDLRRIVLGSSKHWLVDPGELTDSSVVVHGITHSDVSSAPNIEQVLPKVLKELAGRLVVVHYRGMEREFFRRLGFDLWHQPLLFPVLDTFAIECSHVSREQSVVRKLLRSPLPSLRLPDVRQRYHLPDYENHNALIDAIATAEVFQAMVQKQGLSDKPLGDLIV